MRLPLWHDAHVDDAIARYREASEANDIERMMETLSTDAELISPISGRMVFRGRDDLRVLLTAVYGSLNGLRWHRQVADGDTHVVIGDANVGPVKIGDAMVFELADDGRIKRISPHLRPWLALTLFALVLGPKVGRHPGVVRRALRRR
jgi:SnoaL-like domain